MTDRFLPDKAIDALDEAGSRIHITNIVVPKQIVELESKARGNKDRQNECGQSSEIRRSSETKRR